VGGLFGAVGGAMLTWVINLHYLMLVTGVLVLYLAVVTTRRGITGRGVETEPLETPPAAEENGRLPSGQTDDAEQVDSTPSALLAMSIGLAAGLFSGLLGVGGGIILIPGFIYLLHMPLKKAFGTSLAVITVIAVPGTVVHAFLHHIYWPLALFLAIGSIPGAYLGARLSIRSRERTLYILFGLLLAALGVVFIVNEIISMTG
jgi:uncharacterized protein